MSSVWIFKHKTCFWVLANRLDREGFFNSGKGEAHREIMEWMKKKSVLQKTPRAANPWQWVDYFAHRKIAFECGLTFCFFGASLYKSSSLHQNNPWRTFCIDAAEDPILNIAPRDFLHNIVYSVNNYMSTNHPLCTFDNIVYSVHNYMSTNIPCVLLKHLKIPP